MRPRVQADCAKTNCLAGGVQRPSRHGSVHVARAGERQIKCGEQNWKDGGLAESHWISTVSKSCVIAALDYRSGKWRGSMEYRERVCAGW